MAAISIILILGFVVIYIILIEIFSVLFRITGLTKEKSVFQAISLLTNSGFTTSESEIVTSEKFRRKVAIAAMITGNVFSVLIISLALNLLMRISNIREEEGFLFVVLLGFGVFCLLVIIMKLPFVRKAFDRLIENIALRMLRRTDKENILTQMDNYGDRISIYQILINTVPPMLDGVNLFESKLKEKYNINVMLIRRKGKIIEVTKDTMLSHDDIITVIGNYQNIRDVFRCKVKKGDEKMLINEKNVTNLIELIDNYGEDAMAEVTINTLPELLTDKSLYESDLKKKYQINVIMIKRNGKALSPKKDTAVFVGDVLTVFGPYKTIKEIFTTIL